MQAVSGMSIPAITHLYNGQAIPNGQLIVGGVLPKLTAMNVPQSLLRIN